jgi:hypothetical protein
MFRLLSPILTVFAVSVLGTVPPARASEGVSCPAYSAALVAAKTSVVRGDRASALQALRRAQEALADCIRESSEETALAACAVERKPPA